MENLELSLSTLATICSHIDESHSGLSQFLSKQTWSQQDRRGILECLAQVLLEKDYALLIARHSRALVLDLLERNAERVKANGKINHDLHERLCVALSKLLCISPDAQAFSARYFNDAPPVFQRLFFTSEEASTVQYGPRRMKLRDLMAATLRFLKSDCAKFEKLWDWSPCVSQLLMSDVMVRGYTAHCLALVSHMTDNQKTIFLSKVLTSDEILQMKIRAFEEVQQMEVEKALVLANEGSALWRKENKYTQGQFASEDLSQNVVSICGIVLSRNTPKQTEQVNERDMVLVNSTCLSLKRLALAVASQKPVLLEGPIGCGKTALVEFMAGATGHTKTTKILKVQLGDQTDSKLLLGMYRCTDIPGKFIWQPGTLTEAVSKGLWILLEDIDHAPLDVISVLLPLMENKTLMIPGREDCIDISPGFQFFATRRINCSGGSWHKPPNSNAALLDKYWTKLEIGNMTRKELKTVVIRKYPALTMVADRLLDIYCHLTGERHSDLSCDRSPNENQQYKSEESPTQLEGRALSLRDLLKWCERVSVNFNSTSSTTAHHVFQEALDCFTAMMSHPESQLRMAEIIGSKLNISKEKVQHFCQMYQPAISLTEYEASVGRVTLVRKQTETVHLSIDHQTFAATRPAAVLLERLAVCIAKQEPVLLVGETGTGKTTTVQHLARVTGHRLLVVNMNQQSDTADLLGGYKPVDHKQILLPLREAFEDLFSQTYSRKQNLTFLGHVQTCFREKRWHDLLKLMDHVCKSFLTKELQENLNAALLQEKWDFMARKLSQTRQQIRACETAMIFAFVEGTLAKAVKKGYWILLDEINLAAAETLECLSGLLESGAGSLVLLDRGDFAALVRHPDFRLFACMNPATDVGKRNLPLGLRNRFTELYVEELDNEGDLRILVSDYLKNLNLPRSVIDGIIRFYLAVRKEATSHLVDGTGNRPHYSLRTLCRALKYVAANPCRVVQRSLYEGFCLSFLTQLDRMSHPMVQKLVCQHVLKGNTKCLNQPIAAPLGQPCLAVEGYWVSQGELEPTLDPSYILTASVKLNLRDLARVVSAGTHPVLIQGETSVGKTSLIHWLATATGNQCVRINNHEHTDIQEYIGCYSSNDKGKLVFAEGILIDAMRKGYWIILDELNLAPTDVLEALNRLLDDNRELFVVETQEVIKAHPRFMLFATQNPPGLYGGRKVLSRAFRNRFVELHFDELPSKELETILHERCNMPLSYCAKLVRVMTDLQSRRRGSSVFAGKHGFITLRDLFRWAERYRMEEQTEASHDWLQHLADDGYMLLAGRVRKPEEEATILSILERHFKRTVNPENLFSQKLVNNEFSPLVDSTAGVPEDFHHVVWTRSMRRLAVLVGRALRFGESVLLVGDTGCGKTTICQLFAALAGKKLFYVTCHLHMETTDFLGGLRPVRHSPQADGDECELFHWHDGPLVLAMKKGGVFLMDEISLADDSVLERLNSVLEMEKSLVLAEKGSGDDNDVELIRAAEGFRLVATMNPGGDFGKKELSPALRNRFTEIWCPQSNDRTDLYQIIQHNLRPGLSLDGGDIADLILDFIEWLTLQDFGRHCILSVRDILSWVNYLNVVCKRDDNEGGADWDLKQDTVQAIIHAACLVYIDGIGSGTTVSSSNNATMARKMCLGFLHKRLSKMTKPDQETLDALRIYDTSLLRAPQWGKDFFGINPFYVPLGPLTESNNLSDYTITAGTAAMNAQRLLRALKLRKPVLLEGSPGVGKTSLVSALAKASGNHLVRINLSEQTDVPDLFGADLPVEGGKGGEFAWRDGPLLAALKKGHWVLLDELNLASQSVLEGLNACFDHRAEIFIAELGMTFQVQQDKTKIFGCQNPYTQGGGRKGLPKSFLNRFTQMFVDQLTSKDMEFIGVSHFPAIDKEIISRMVQFSDRLFREVSVERRWGQKGSPWEFNLRDIFRWCQLMQADHSPGFFSPGQHVALVYADKMRTEADKAQVLTVFRKVFGEDVEPYVGSGQFHITPLSLQVGFSVLQRSGGAPAGLDPPLSITHRALRPLESLMKCVEMNWMTILVGPTGSGKTSLVRLLALLSGNRLRVMAMNSAMDTTELLGGFEQVDIMRPWQHVLRSVYYLVAMVTRRGLMSLDVVGLHDTEFLLQTWGLFCQWLRDEKLESSVRTLSSEALDKLEVIILLLQKLNTKLKVFTDMSKLKLDFMLLKEQMSQQEDGWTNGGFEWLDGMLIQALHAGDWLLMDNVNFCSASVLDRLNALLEPGGSLTINERGVIDGKTPIITPHPNFRLFLTMDPVHGELSRAMRNRGVEIYIPGENDGISWDTLDLKTLLRTAGVTGDCVCNLLIEIHKSIKSAIWDSPVSSVASMFHAATLLYCQLQRGVDLPSALQHACQEAYSFSQHTAASQKLAQQVIEQHLAILDTNNWDTGLLCPGVWPDSFPSALLSTEDSCFSTVLRDGQVLSFCLNTLSLQGKRNRPLSLSDLQKALQSTGFCEDQVFLEGGESVEQDMLQLMPTAVRLVTERASHGDWIMRSSWLSHLGKSYRYAPALALVQVEAGNRALKAVFSSELAAQGKSLAELLQPNNIDEHKILVDMRWNKQYLDILANKCNFEDEKRYTEFLEALNAVANRIALLKDREERAVICTCTVNLSAHNCALRIATAFSKGTVDIGHLAHPVLIHLHSFFDLWDSFTLQAVHSGKAYIPDHVMFEILRLLQWLDHFWNVCNKMPADTEGVAVMSMHWQWVQKHLILRLPLLLLGDADVTLECYKELKAVVGAIQTLLSTPVSVALALKGIQRTLGKCLPFKMETVAKCASQLRVLSKALDVRELTFDHTFSSWKQELVCLQVAGLRADIKESLLEAWGLVLLANNQLDTEKSAILERLASSVEHLQHQMSSSGLSETRSMYEEAGPAEGFPPSRQELQHLIRRAQLWPLMEEAAVLNQLRLSTDILQLSFSHSDQEALETLRQELSRHIRYCLQSTPMSVSQLRPLWFLLGREKPAEELQFVWCELLSEALAALWRTGTTSDPDHWLKWNPLNPEKHPDSEANCEAKNMGPALLNKALWSHCTLGVLTGSATGRQWEPSGSALLFVSHVTLGEWKEQILQLQDLSAILWDNMAFPALEDLRGTDLRLQGAILRRQLQSMAHLLPLSLRELYMDKCKNLVEEAKPPIAAQEIHQILSDFIPPKLLPDGVVDSCIACLKQYVENRTEGTKSVAGAGVFWVNMGLLHIKLWAPQTIFDPAVKRAYKLNYAQQELALLQTEWKVRSLSSELMTGAELEESRTTDGLQHPRIRYLWICMQQVKAQIAELSRKQAFRPQEAHYGKLFQDLQHYLCSISQASAVQDLLSHLQSALQSSSSLSRSAIRGLLKEETVWQNSQQCFCQRLQEDYPLYPDVVRPMQAGILQLRYGMKLVAARVTDSLYHVPELAKLVSCLLSFPSISPSLQSYLAQADFLCSKESLDIMSSLGQRLSQQDIIQLDLQPSTLLLNALLFVQCHTLGTGQFSDATRNIFRHICQALVNEWDEMEKKKRDREQQEACLYRSRSKLHGTGLTEAQQEEKDFRCQFPQFEKDFADMCLPSLEGPTDARLEDGDAVKVLDESHVLSTTAMNTLVQIHQRLCRGFAQSLWYQNRSPKSPSTDYVKALVCSYQIAAPLIAHFYHLIDAELNQQLAGSELLLSTLLQNTVQGSPGSDMLVLTSEGPYDFYQHPNIIEARLCLPVLEEMWTAVKQRLEDWPDHPVLVQLVVVIERIMTFSLSSPLAKFLNGLEILLSKAQDWENNASRAVSLQSNMTAITQLIMKWHKLELNCWSSSLDNAVKRHTEKSTHHWFSIYQLLAKYLEDQMMNADTGKEMGGISLSSLSSTLQAFVECSSLGEFNTRLAMLLSFHCHLLLLPTQPGQAALSHLLWNLHKYYSQFSDCIQNKVRELRQPIEKDLKDFVKISKWNDVSFWSIKQSVEKSHRTLFKFVKKFEDILNGPCVALLVEQKNTAFLDNSDINPKETPIRRIRRALKRALPGKNREQPNKGQDEAVELESLQGRLPLLARKMEKVCAQLLKKHPALELTEDLEFFAGEVLRNVHDLQGLAIDMSIEKDKQMAQVKHILQQKQRALSSLFKILTEIGLSYRKGLIWCKTADQEETLCIQPLDISAAFSTLVNLAATETTLMSELLSAWDGCQHYFYRSWARINALRLALQHAKKELGLGNIERCKGFSSHLFNLLLRQRQRLAKLTEQWVRFRMLTSTVQDIKDQLQSQREDTDCTLLPQAPLHGWVDKGQALAAQFSILLQQLSWLLQCCPEALRPQEEENSHFWRRSLRCTSPMAAHRQSPVCQMRKGDAAWGQLNRRVAAMLEKMLHFKSELHKIAQQSSERVLLTWKHFVTCCSAFDQLATAASQLCDIERLFAPATCIGGRNLTPAVIRSLRFVRQEAMNNIAEFTLWKTQHLSVGQPTSDDLSPFCCEFSAELEANISSLLCAVQTLVKRRENNDNKGPISGKEEVGEERVKDLLKPGHLTHQLEEELAADVEALCVGDVNARLERLLGCLEMHTNSSRPQKLREVNRACGMLVRVEPLLGIYSDLVRYFLSVSVGVHRCTGKLLAVLANIFTELAQKGFCLPQETNAGEGEGATEFHDYEGGGIGQGEGTKDVSDTIESEDQVEDTLGEDQEKEHQDDEKIQAEDNAVEMSEDFDGPTHDGDEQDADVDELDQETERELDQKMGDLGDGQTNTLDERMWGDDEEEEDDDDDDDDEGASDREEESGQGMDQGESALVAKDDNVDAAEPPKNERASDDQMDGEGQDEINEQRDEREFDKNEVDPYHGQQDKRPEPDAISLPEDLNLDQDDEMGDDREGDVENPLDIEEEAINADGDEDGPKEGDEEEEAEPVEKDESNQEDDNREPEPKTETEESGHEVTTEESKKEENLPVPKKEGTNPKEEESDAMDDVEHQPESAQRKEHKTEGQTGEQNFQSDTAVELAGEAPERDGAKEEHGTGAADANESAGHQSKLTARMASQTQTQNNTQSFKRKPGQADNERSTGDDNELVNKRLRTLESTRDRTHDSTRGEIRQESDLYEHINEKDMAYDSQTYDVANANQEAAGPQQVKDENLHEEDLSMETEDFQASEVQELKHKQLDGTETLQQQEAENVEMHPQRQENERNEWKDSRHPRDGAKAERKSQSSFHTLPELLIDTMQNLESDPGDIRREMEVQLSLWHQLTPGTQEEESAAAHMWHQYQTMTDLLSQQLSEQLRLILEPTQAAKLKGDYRTGKRLNMRKVIPYIASQFRKDKIWLRRTKPSKRDYQICLALDDSSSMGDNHSKQLAFESLSVIVKALTLLEVGQVSVYSFGEEAQLLHPFQQQFSDDSGARILRLCKFQQKKTRIAQFLESATEMFLAARKQILRSTNSETAQLLIVVSDGRGLFLEGKDRVMAAIQAARSANVFLIFVALDNPDSRDSIVDIKVPVFQGPGELPEIRSYMEEFPFPFYVILRDVNALPETLSDALRQWFELVTAAAK